MRILSPLTRWVCISQLQRHGFPDSGTESSKAQNKDKLSWAGELPQLGKQACLIGGGARNKSYNNSAAVGAQIIHNRGRVYPISEWKAREGRKRLHWSQRDDTDTRGHLRATDALLLRFDAGVPIRSPGHVDNQRL